MNSNTKGLLYIVLGVLSLAWFGYEVIGYMARGGVRPEESAVMEYGLTALKLVMTITFFVSGINSLRKKD
jgi:hypothetical protein